jgi:isoleucyl-tRNA synthetase
MTERRTVEKSETAKREEEILAFWRENKTFERSLEKKAPKGEFVFYDGPPFANGLPHIGHLLASSIKDVVGRYKTMRGYHVRRRWGWDTHGLPIETLVEKKLGLKTKKDILEIGVEKFNATAREMVFGFEREWEKYVERIGRWVDFKNSYKTMDNTFIESVWWALKRLWDKGLLYEGRKVLMYCTHCETPLAKAEIAMDNTYKDITEEAVTVKFKVKNPAARGLPENTFILAWTTTPWTLPGNVALAVGGEITYALSKVGDGHVITAEKLAPKDAAIVKKMAGADLVGLEYEPLFDIKAMQTEKSHRVYAADFVSTDEGAGIVHTAVMYGEDDFVLGQKEGLPMVQMLNPNGTYLETMPELLRGKYIKDAEKDIKRDLESRGLMFERKNHTHSYPHCYRCGTPLIYNAVASWFINIQEVKSRMVSENQKVLWVPEHLKNGRFGKIVEGAPDWTISRNRFWASPLPIWKSATGKVMVVGGLDEIKQRVKKSGNQYFVMRHGEAESNVKGIVDGDPSAQNHLTENGKKDIAEAAGRIREKNVKKIYASPFLRTRETAEIIRKELQLPESSVVIDERLREVNPGVLDQKPVEEFRGFFKSWAERFVKAPEGGTDYSVMRRRLGEFLLEIDSKERGSNILLVTHESPAFILSMIAAGETPEQGEKRFASGTETVKNGEILDLRFAHLPWNAEFELDLHRPYTDNLILIGDDGEEYARIPEVVDCWVESGSMAFAELHYPFENKAEFERSAPGDFITEYIAQTRTWFYYMHAMGVLLFDRQAFKACVSTGTILAADGEKMSKSKGNYTDPLENLDRYGADAMRLYLMGAPIMQAEDLRFRDEELRDTHNRTIGILWNTFKFFDLYQKEYDGKTDARKSEHVLDRWVLARLDETTAEVTMAMDAYDTPATARAIRAFVDDYSTWYVRRSRDRVKSEWHDKQYCLATQREVLLTLSKLIAPIMPFIAESIYRGIEAGGSVHLEAWPEAVSRGGFFSRLFGGVKAGPILEEMAGVRAIVSQALQARDKAGIKVRQPLAKLTIKQSFSNDLLDVIRDEVNVKGVVVGQIEGDVELDTNLTPELKEEGFVRDLIRAIQGARKEAGLNPGENAQVTLTASHEVQDLIAKHTKTISDATHVTVAFGEAANMQKVGEHEIGLGIVK